MMEENKVENIYDSMKYYCRVCTANTRTKKSRPDDCIGIFKRAGLKSILEKYLQLQISEDDALPKVICKSCFDKIEAIEFLRVIARRTENLLRDFLKNQESQAPASSQFQNEYNSFAISKSSTSSKAVDEVVVNVSLSDPLTKNIDKKLQVAQRKKESLDKAFSPAQINRNAVTSSPNLSAVTIVHQMPRKNVPSPLVEKRKSLQMSLSNATTVTLEKAPPPALSPAVKLPVRNKVTTAPPPLRHISEAPTIQQKVEIHPVITENTHSLSNSITLGSIIKDEDLVRLILKALKWPVNNQTLDIQIQRLKNTKFSDVIVDPNLLQDTDLIQILWPLINPNLVQMPAVPQPPTYHITLPPEPIAIPSTTISYKLPAETSVQIITVPPEENASPKPQNVPKPMPQITRPVIKKKRRPCLPPHPPRRPLDVIVVSDESDEDAMKELRSNEEIQRFEVQVDPVLFPGVGENSNSNEAMLATLNRQREAMMRMHRNKRRKHSVLGKNMEMVGDITIIDEGVQLSEPYPEVVLVKKPRKIQHTTPVPSTSLSKSVKSTITLAEPEKVPSAQPILTTFPKLPTIAPRKMPALIPKTTNSSQPTDASSLIRLPPKKCTPPTVSKLTSISSQYNGKNTTLADADSTTKIVVKEKKVSKAQNPHVASSDIEDQISKVRIGKQPPKSVGPDESRERRTNVKENEKVVIVVEYEDEEGERRKETDIKNDEVNKTTVVESSKGAEKEKGGHGGSSEEMKKEQATNPANETSKNPTAIELPPIEIKTEPESERSKFDAESTNEYTISASEKKADDEDSESGRTLLKSSIKDDAHVRSRPGRKRKIEVKKESPKIVATTAYRPARRSKTLSKYYKGPPVAADLGRSMRSRT